MKNEPLREITFVDVAFTIVTLMMFSKTADVMVFFTPLIVTEAFGNVSLYYGAMCAVIVEGIMFALHFHPRANGGKHQAVKWILFVVSAICQWYDGILIANTISDQTDTIKQFFTNGFPLLLPFILALLLWMGKLPEADAPKKPFVGLRNMRNPFDYLMYGQGGKTPNVAKPVNTNAQNVPTPKLPQPAPAGSQNKNPTSGSNGTQ